jgi:hypothetical protein
MSSAQEKTTSWWMPEQYVFETVSGIADEDWTAESKDMPDTTAMVSERPDREGKRWVVLQAYPEWSSMKGEEDLSRKYR